jgi:hypothetical protein
MNALERFSSARMRDGENLRKKTSEPGSLEKREVDGILRSDERPL